MNGRLGWVVGFVLGTGGVGLLRLLVIYEGSKGQVAAVLPKYSVFVMLQIDRLSRFIWKKSLVI